MSQCRSCDAPIVWAVHVTTGSLAPIDEEPTEGGNVVLTDDAMGIRYRVLGEPADEAELHTNHFATCPDATTHRRQTTKT